MASATITLDPQRFPSGTNVGAYRQTAWSGRDYSLTPTGAADATGAVGSTGQVTFANLTDQATYRVYAPALPASGSVLFSTRHDVVDDAVGSAVGAVAYDSGAGAWPARPAPFTVVFAVGGPSAPAWLQVADVWLPAAPTTPKDIGAAIATAIDRDLRYSGLFTPTLPIATVGTTALTANRAVSGRFVPSRDMAIIGMRFFVTTAAGSNDNADVGLYDAAGNALARKGSTAGLLNAVGMKSVALGATVNLVAGKVYYATLGCGAIGTTAASVLSASSGAATASDTFGAGTGLRMQGFADAAFPLPAAVPLAGGALSNTPLLVCSEV